MFQDLTSIVLDLGTSRTRIGYGGDDAPRLMPHSYVARDLGAMNSEQESDFRIGDKHLWSARTNNQVLSIYHRKGQQGYQFDYSILEPFLDYYLTHELGADLKDYSVLLSEDLAAKMAENRQFREKTAQFLFEKLGCANLFYLKSPVLSCFATGRSTALVVDSGENYTRSVAVHEGYCLLKSARVAPYGGSHLSRDIEHLIAQKTGEPLINKFSLSGSNYTHSFLDFHQHQLLGDIKEALSVRKQEQSGSDALFPTVDYELPDHKTITLDRKQIRQGFLSGEEQWGFKGAASMASESVNSCDVDIKKELYSNMLLTGGNLLFGSYAQDFVTRVGENSPSNIKVKGVSICAAPQRKYLSWIGGSIVTSLSSFQSYWVGSQEWKECGAVILQRKCT